MRVEDASCFTPSDSKLLSPITGCKFPQLKLVCSGLDRDEPLIDFGDNFESGNSSELEGFLEIDMKLGILDF